MRYLLNSAVITAPGTYEYLLITPEEMRPWLEAGPWESTCGYAETCSALEDMTGIAIPFQRKAIKMEPGDTALVFRLAIPAGAERPSDRLKGRLTSAFVRRWAECGILRRTE